MFSWLFGKKKKQETEEDIEEIIEGEFEEEVGEDTLTGNAKLFFRSMYRHIINLETSNAQILEEARYILTSIAMKYGNEIVIPKSISDVVKKNGNLNVAISYDKGTEAITIKLVEENSEANQEQDSGV